MPAGSIKMQIHNLRNNSPSLGNSNVSKNVAPVNVVNTLNSPMVLRIHNVKAGCSSCGKK